MTSPQVLPDQSLAWAIIWDGVVLIATREGLRVTAYQCQAGVWTIGWGETEGIVEGMVWTKQQSDLRLEVEIQKYADAVKGMCTKTPNDYQLAAMVSLAYNIGLRDDKKKSGLYYSSVLRLHNAGDFNGAARAFAMLNEYRDPKTGKLAISDGLNIRRQQESGMYMTPDPNVIGADNIDMPQEVAPEKPMIKSPISNAGLVGTGASAITVVSAAITGGQGAVVPSQVSLDNVATVVGKVKDVSDQASSTYTTVAPAVHGLQKLLAEYDLNVPEVFGSVALVAAAVAFWYRQKQRATGVV